jgi:hypothetical protein
VQRPDANGIIQARKPPFAFSGRSNSGARNRFKLNPKFHVVEA